jgi:hypothetical protein
MRNIVIYLKISLLAAINATLGYTVPQSNHGTTFSVERGQLSSVFTASYLLAKEKLGSGFTAALGTQGGSSFTSPVFNLAYLRELDRLKENFTKDTEQHQIIVAKDEANELIGYVDLDRRNFLQERYPTPYISGGFLI